jgi:hypothetical protein
MKFNRDHFYSNNFIAQMCGVRTEELNDLELYTLEIIDFKLYIDELSLEEYDQALTNCFLQGEVSASFFHSVLDACRCH